MSHSDAEAITAMLAAWSGGDERARDRLMDAVYPELRRMARRHLARRRWNGSLESGVVANEAYLKLARAGGIPCENRLHFLALCAQMMRRIVVDAARRRGSLKRGGDGTRVPLEELVPAAETRGIELLALDEALRALAEFDARKCRVVEMRYFAGLSNAEVAEVLGVSLDTVKRDWRMARAWLLNVLASNGTVGGCD